MNASRAGTMVLGAVLVAALSGCLADASDEKAVSTTTATVPDSVPPAWADVEALLPDDPPDGFEKAADAVARTGAIDTPRAVENDRKPDAAQFFDAQEFRKGYERRFIDGTGMRHVDVWIYEFDSPSGALAWMLRTVGQAGDGGSGVDASGIPNGSGAQRPLPDGTVAVIAYPAGNRVVRVESQDPLADTAVERAREAAQKMLLEVPPPAS